MAKKTCWYCGEPATEVWHSDWDQGVEAWPMCEKHSTAVRTGIALRAAGKDEMAHEHDLQIGIDSGPSGGNWIDPREEGR